MPASLFQELLGPPKFLNDLFFSRVPHLSISSSTPPPLQLGGAPLSPDSMGIKSEPVSPPHIDHRSINRPSSTGHLSPIHQPGAGPHTPSKSGKSDFRYF